NTGDIVIVEDVISARKSQSRSGNYDWDIVRSRLLASVNLPAALEHVSKHSPEFCVVISIQGRGGYWGWSRGWLRRRDRINLSWGFHDRFGLTSSQTCRVEAAQSLVEGNDVAKFRMIGEQ